MISILFSLIIGGARSSGAGVTYYSGTYPETHWALQYPTLADESVVAIIHAEGLTFGVRLHPFDRRGYRGLVMLIDPDMASTLNRRYTLREKLGLQRALALVSEAYERRGMIAQTLVLGNNAHSFDHDRCEIILGNSAEPLLLHGHVVGRGDPRTAYAGDVPLDGPPLGEVFEVRGEMKPWAAGEPGRVASALREAMAHVLSEVTVVDH